MADEGNVELLKPEFHNERPPHHISKPRTKSILFPFLLGFTAATILSLIGISTRFSSHSTLPIIPSGIDKITGKPSSWFGGPCGRSSTEARERNCQFDQLSFSWIPSSYYTTADRQDEVEFLQLQKWRYEFSNGSMTDIEAMLERNDMYVFTAWDWHVAHCALLWRRFHRKIAAGEEIDSYIGAVGHSEHCTQVVLRTEVSGWGTRVFVKYPRF